MKMFNVKRLASTNCRFQYNGNVVVRGDETSAHTKTRALGLKGILKFTMKTSRPYSIQYRGGLKQLPETMAAALITLNLDVP